MKSILACRAGNRHLPTVASAGLEYAEVILPPLSRLDELRNAMSAHGLSASSVTVNMNVQNEEGTAHLEEAFSAVESLGARYVFTSVQAGDVGHGVAAKRLRHVGDIAAQYGLVVAMETHPDLAHNGELARQTMEMVDHENARINFDTANIYYYNHDLNSVTELEHILPYVASVHLKDTMGGYHSSEFPPLGQGVVDFPAIFRLLSESGFSGPLTLEIEGARIRDDQLTFAQALEQSLEYLQTLGIRP